MRVTNRDDLVSYDFAGIRRLYGFIAEILLLFDLSFGIDSELPIICGL